MFFFEVYIFVFFINDGDISLGMRTVIKGIRIYSPHHTFK